MRKSAAKNTSPSSTSSSYSYAHFIRYKQTPLAAALPAADYNSYMDDHVGILVGNAGLLPPFLKRLSARNASNFNFLTRGRNNFESVLVAMPASGFVVQFLWVDQVKAGEGGARAVAVAATVTAAVAVAAPTVGGPGKHSARGRDEK
jgi:hypothetical protein